MLKIILVAFLAFLVQYSFKVLLTLDVHKRTYNHRPGPCRKIEGVVNGSEDITISYEKNLAFITSGLVFLHSESSKTENNGEMFVYDLSQRTYKAERIPVKNLEDSEFLPHGISHWVLKDGTVRLFVVVHSKDFKHSIVILDYDEKNRVLNHVRTIRDDKFVRPNDVLATGENSFFVSNDGGCHSNIGNILEIATGFHKGSLVHYDGKNSHYLLENTATNGIILSNDKKTLYVSFIYEETIGVFDWNVGKQEIREVSKIETLTACDNFHVDEDDNLWSACHPVLKDAAKHLGNHKNKDLHSPTQVLRFKFSEDRKFAEIVEVFSDEGRFTSAGAVATSFDNGKQMLIGTVFRDVTHCDINISLDF
ncbi:hypothetical protein CRE_08730 [Caenorhabditis remanei]|uniref:SMP-30/Gluconolactonase/LRE-like region domain-containing protein n=1 Tax=Caenorhabditis remanei TaxID=31234 RepID=E3LJL8_CAERE|nr:hypothetical protein CRE_08730 [Caenorhabditis remanei]